MPSTWWMRVRSRRPPIRWPAKHHGIRSEARRRYAALSPEARDWSGADLEAARAACPNKLDFAKLLPEVDRHLA